MMGLGEISSVISENELPVGVCVPGGRGEGDMNDSVCHIQAPPPPPPFFRSVVYLQTLTYVDHQVGIGKVVECIRGIHVVDKDKLALG